LVFALIIASLSLALSWLRLSLPGEGLAWFSITLTDTASLTGIDLKAGKSQTVNGNTDILFSLLAHKAFISHILLKSLFDLFLDLLLKSLFFAFSVANDIGQM